MGLKELFQGSAVVLKKDYFQGMFVVRTVDYLLEVLLPVLQGDINVKWATITHFFFRQIITRNLNYRKIWQKEELRCCLLYCISSCTITYIDKLIILCEKCNFLHSCFLHHTVQSTP